MKKIILKIIYHTLAFFTRIYIARTKPFVIGITGNVGKTSCRMIINKVLNKYIKDKTIYTSPKNFNSELGIIFSIFKIEQYKGGIKELLNIFFYIVGQTIKGVKNYDILILEYGIDHPGDMDFLLKVVKPDISIFTKLGNIHVEYFGTMENIGIEKFKLMANTKQKTYLNFEDEFLRNRYDTLKIKKQFFNNSEIDFEYVKDSDNIYSVISMDGKTIKTNVLGTENYPYIELAYFILSDLGVIVDSIVDNEDILYLDTQPGRFSIFKGVNNSILVDSSYNAGPESMKKMIENVENLRDKIYTDYKLGFVIGDMRELGNLSKELHEQLFSNLINNDLLITVGKDTQTYFPKNIKNFSSSKDAGLYLKDLLNNTSDKYIILFKGSQNTIFTEEALKKVLLDKNDEQKLPRQDIYWINMK
ncbi:MAG: Mur ligase family protein [Candidatus Gracilibacteria bacterium]|nr:Mur ligase family protein [Candidatus Gracilibacteria bacterium]